MTLRHSYTVFAPIYDAMVAPFTRQARRRSLALLLQEPVNEALIVGIGSGLDIPLLPPGPRYVGLDLTPAMLARAEHKAAGALADINLELGDAGALRYPDASFDAVIMHLILAVVPHSQQALAEASRVLRPGGRILILDKFLRPDQRAPLRRLLSPAIARVATRMDVVFEELLQPTEELEVIEDHPALAGGWFRHIVLKKQGYGR